MKQGLIVLLLLSLSAVVTATDDASQNAWPASSAIQYTVYLPKVRKAAAGNVNRTTTGRMPCDETWRGELLITGDVEIPPGVTLTIEPATTIKFTAQSDDQHEPGEYDPQAPSTYHATMISILVRGALRAQGTAEQPITFTSDSELPGEMDWQSIVLEDSGVVYLDHVVIEHGHFGLQLNSVDLDLSMTNSTVRHATNCCICTDRHPITGPIVIFGNQFIDCRREAIDTYADQAIVVHHNVFAENHVGIMSVGSSIMVEGNLFIGNGRGIGVIEDGTPAIIGNEFTETAGAAIFVTEASPLITHNNLHANVWNVQLEDSERGVTAENNYWGSARPDVIGQTIWDGHDDPSLGLVDFEPYAWQPFDLNLPEYE
jgi:hypothetical protein